MVNGILLKAKSCSQGVLRGAVCSPILFMLTYIIFYGFFFYSVAKCLFTYIHE